MGRGAPPRETERDRERERERSYFWLLYIYKYININTHTLFLYGSNFWRSSTFLFKKTNKQHTPTHIHVLLVPRYDFFNMLSPDRIHWVSSFNPHI